MAWDDGEMDGERIRATAYDVSLQGEGTSVENSRARSLREALAFARSRASWVMVRPEWDQEHYYWAGEGPAPRDVTILPS